MSLVFFVKDYWIRRLLLRCYSSGDLYSARSPTIEALMSSNYSIWHQRLGYPDDKVVHVRLNIIFFLIILIIKLLVKLVIESKLLGFHLSYQISLFHFFFILFTKKFGLLWLLVILISNIMLCFLTIIRILIWVFPLRHKSYVSSKFKQFHSFIQTPSI